LGGSPSFFNLGEIMKVISNEDMYVATTWGAAIRLYAGEPKEVGDDIGYVAIQQGAREIKDNEPLEKPDLIIEAEVIEVQDAEVIEDVEEVILEEEDGRGELLKAAMQQILDEGDPDSFTSDGLPKQSVIKAVFGEQITSDERDEVWAEIVVDKED
tara:strand:- start:2592 stop:3059 length:468 start_codon:yes stop_codon:yes gene_type:complete